MNDKPPLNLPVGSVRAILAIIVIGSYIAACFVQIGNEYINSLAALSGVAVTHYFNARQEPK